jgi:hypothetical protein
MKLQAVVKDKAGSWSEKPPGTARIKKDLTPVRGLKYFEIGDAYLIMGG